ncbi:MAG: MaoC/PaaZ C-terminal domain-containing protein [Moraxella sp.]|nr:MaoC/PaaZ C-terminal domain-containing protein [Moraxella sp.]
MSDHDFKELPKAHTTYANVIKSMLPVGDKRASKHDLPTSTYRVARLIIDESNLKEYRKICGFVSDGRVPATYFAVLSQALQMNMMAKPDFPFAMLGLVHIANRVRQYRPIFDSEIASLAVRLDNLAPHDKGQQFDFITEVHIGDELVWQGSSTYLSRQKKSAEERQAARNKPKVQTEFTKLIAGDDGVDVVIDVPEDMGRRYAFVSGDFNLIHLHPLSARAFGFPKAIAHGMWSKACVLARLPNLPDGFEMAVEFKLPIFLPSKVELVAAAETDGVREFGVYALGGDKPHLLGSLTALDGAI